MTGTSRVPVAIVDESHTETSRALLAALVADSGLRVLTQAKPREHEAAGPLTRAEAEGMVRSGDVPAALVLPAGIDTSIMVFTPQRTSALVLYDPSDPVASRMVSGLLQRAALRASGVFAAAAGAPGSAAAGGREGPDASREGFEAGREGSQAGREGPDADGSSLMPIRVASQAVLGERRESPMIAFYAAGIAVMFIMFSAAGAGGVLIEETESGTLERVLTTGLGMNGLLAAKWLYLTSLACMQIVVMFTWGMLVFKLPLLSHLPGFAVMTVFTAGAAAAFGLVLATLSRTRQQLSGLANLLVLSLNAIGGSMFPRFLMSETLQKFSLVGFNAWALDGYLKVFWREQPLAALLPQVGALLGFTVLFLVLARRLARRWEVA
jgi:ABC-2 type transport system permease protein